MTDENDLLPNHGGYKNLKSFQLAQLIYDLTTRFCDQYIDNRSRTKDQMIQAARSGVQNIAEGSQAAGTSKKTELRLTNVARASLEELRLDYEDYLRQRNLPQWQPNHPALRRFKSARPATLQQVQTWIQHERELDPQPPRSAVYAANAILSLLNLCTHLLNRQIQTQAKTFKEEGGFTERLYRTRTQHRDKKR